MFKIINKFSPVNQKSLKNLNGFFSPGNHGDAFFLVGLQKHIIPEALYTDICAN